MKKQTYTVPEGCKITSVDLEKGVVVFESEEPKIKKYRFKKGQFVKFQNSGNIIILSKDTPDNKRGETFYKSCFIKIRKDGSLEYDGGTADIIEVTEDEKQFAISKMHEAGKDWDEEKCEVIDYVWKPKEGEIFVFITSDGVSTVFYYEKYHSDLIKINNCFKTYELAQIAWDKVKEVLKEVKHF